MPASPPKVFLRLGSHAEKDYFEKVGKSADGVILGANLVESTPGATASLVVKLSGEKMLGSYFLDPMTYAFGEYVDPEKGLLRTDLDWIKSEQKVKTLPNKKAETIRTWKKSYAALAAKYGGVFQGALTNGKGLNLTNFVTEKARTDAAMSTVNFQLNRLRDEFANDEEFKAYADMVQRPTAVFAPYFYIEPQKANDVLTLNIQLATAAAELGVDAPVHAVLCADCSFLSNPALLNRVIQELAASGVAGIWLWFSKFWEEKADASQLLAFAKLVQVLSEKVEVYNMHGGYFSLCLSRMGMSGISHGVGYGEQKDVIPVIGQSTPAVRYYLPDVHVRLGIPAIESCWYALGISSAESFHAHICACTVCKGVLGGSLAKFGEFGEMHHSTPSSKRLAQTPAAAKRCRFHFLLKRLEERQLLGTKSVADIRGELDAAFKKWGAQPTIRDNAGHLPRWRDVLGQF